MHTKVLFGAEFSFLSLQRNATMNVQIRGCTPRLQYGNIEFQNAGLTRHNVQERSMRISNCLLPALALATLIASSGSMAAELKVPDAGAKELQFGIGSSFTLHQIDQYMISYQQYLSNKLAWRADFGLDLSSTDGDSKSLYFNSEGEPAIPSDAEYDQSSFGVHLCAQILMYPVQKRISPFLGAGLEWAYSSSTQDEVENSIQDYSRDSSYMRVAGVGSVGRALATDGTSRTGC